VITRTLTILALSMAAPIGAAISQAPTPSPPAPPAHRLTVRVDNDAFDFWMQPWNRPDEEYTSGVHITRSGGDAPRWARSALRGRDACTVGATLCRTGYLEIGQDIYTPSVSVGSERAAPNSRPNGGWLYLEQGASLLGRDRATELAIAAGVTGDPSLARVTQRIAHQAAPQFNRPTDWSRAIGFEPGAIITLAHRRRAVLLDDAIGVDLVPRASLSVGNIRTNTEAGLRLRAGWGLSHPWLPAPPHVELSFLAGAYGRAVVRDIFLDGNSFTSSPQVGHEPFVGGGEAGITLRYGIFEASYRAVSETRAWAGGPKWHPWSSLVGSVGMR
jgi:hypothetical protein